MTELDEQTKVARQKEADFWEWYDKTEPYLHLYNTRQIFDLAYDKGYIAGLARAIEIQDELSANKCVCGVVIDDNTDLCDTCAYPNVETNPEVYADEYQAEINSDGYINYLNNN